MPCVLPNTGWIPGFSACSGQQAWHSCRAGCIGISENPQGLATHVVHAKKKIEYNDASVTTKPPIITTQLWSFLIGYNDEVRRWWSNRALLSQTHIHRGHNSGMKEIKAYRNAAVYEKYSTLSSQNSPSTSRTSSIDRPIVFDFNYLHAIVWVTRTVPYVPWLSLLKIGLFLKKFDSQ